jgi:Cu(I)/Ag(I) efflux system membrane fusion protein
MSFPQSLTDPELKQVPIPQPAQVQTEKQSNSPIAAIIRVVMVRLRFFLVLLIILLLVGYWPELRNYRDRLIRNQHSHEGSISPDTEYWCPMCPSVVSDWPGKCPICNMNLVRRKKGEAVPLPDGVLARMQFSPYRIQLAGVRTANVEYRSLGVEVVLVGAAERDAANKTVEVGAEAFASDIPQLKVGQPFEAAVDGMAGHVPFRGVIIRFDSAGDSTDRSSKVRLKIDDPDRELRAGTLVTARIDAPMAQLPWWQRAVSEEWQSRTVAESAGEGLSTLEASISAHVRSLLESALQRGMFAMGACLAVPCSAVIDHGSRKVAFVENGPGMFDAIEVIVGPRCRDYYPVLRGLKYGQRVAASGAFLIDAEMSLTHDLTASWFGAQRTTNNSKPAPPATSSGSSSSEDDRLLAAKQKICPVTGESLDSMGGPVRVDLENRVVFVCCKSCIKQLRKEPAKYLEKVK